MLSRRSALPAALGLLLAAAGAASADEWTQYRKDARRTAASTDAVKLPLTEIWSRPGGQIGGGKVGVPQQVAIREGRAYYIDAVVGKMRVVCADVRTGAPIWVRFLGANCSIGPGALHLVPALGSDGTAMVLDWDNKDHILNPHAGLRFGDEVDGIDPVLLQPHRHFWIRTFRAPDGAPLGVLPTPNVADNGFPGARLRFQDPGGYDSAPFVGSLVNLPGPFLMSGAQMMCALVSGKSKYAVGIPNARGVPGRGTGVFGAWAAFQCTKLIFEHVVGVRPVRVERFGRAIRRAPGTQSDQIVRFEPVYGRVNLDGYPGVAAGSAIGMAGLLRFDQPGLAESLFTFFSPTGVHWHRHFRQTLGVPTNEGQFIFLPLGGVDAAHGIIALDTFGGNPVWVFAPSGLVPDALESGKRRRDALSGNNDIGESGPTTGLWAGNGAAVVNGRVYVALSPPVRDRGKQDMLVALEQPTGQLFWRQLLPREIMPTSLAASKDHVFVQIAPPSRLRGMSQLAAFRLDNGKLEWTYPIRGGGSTALAQGLLFVADGDLRAFAPAERTFRLAIDTDDPSRYRDTPLRKPEPKEGEPIALVAEPTEPETAKAPDSEGALADATVLRLDPRGDLDALALQIRQRRQAAPRLPLLLSLDWTRVDSGVLPEGGIPDAGELAFRCARLAAAGAPEYLDLAPEINVLLQRNPEVRPAVRALVARVAMAVRQASPATSVLFSVNVEVLRRIYGNGDLQPLGPVPRREEDDAAFYAELAMLVDAVGLASDPQAAFRRASDVPGDYFLGLRKLFGAKPLVVTRLAVRYSEVVLHGNADPNNYLARLLQACYWLDAPVVAYPQLLATPGGQKAEPEALLARTTVRPALAAWLHARSWERVEQLTLATLSPTAPEQALPR